jgi:hypothetical protein
MSMNLEAIRLKQDELVHHPVYQTFSDLESLKLFMSYHVFAVWDFMSLLKSLQRHITCVTVPWRPSPYPVEIVRLINQIVVGEESDVDEQGRPISHFDLYLQAMEEVGAPTHAIRDFLESMDLALIPEGARAFVDHNLKVALKGDAVEVASSFFFGREKLIPEMFTTIVNTLDREGVQAPTLRYYLKRHIEVDGDEHGPLALRCLTHLVGDSMELGLKAEKAGLAALEERKLLWNKIQAIAEVN